MSTKDLTNTILFQPYPFNISGDALREMFIEQSGNNHNACAQALDTGIDLYIQALRTAPPNNQGILVEAHRWQQEALNLSKTESSELQTATFCLGTAIIRAIGAYSMTISPLSVVVGLLDEDPILFKSLDLELRLILIDALARNGQTPEATFLADSILGRYANSPKALFIKAEALFLQARARGNNNDESRVQLQYVQGVLNEALAGIESSEEDYAAELKLCILHNLGCAAEAACNYEQAERYYESALAFASEHSFSSLSELQIRLALGGVLQKQGKDRSHIEHFVDTHFNSLNLQAHLPGMLC